MKRIALFVGLVYLIFAAVLLVTKSPTSDPRETGFRVPPPPVVEGDARLKVTQDQEVIFKQMLWRSPDPEDRILSGERREWRSPETGLRQWRNFLAIQPGPRLAAWLQTNPFRLREGRPAELDALIESAPAWIPACHDARRFKIEISDDATMALVRDRTEGTLHLLGSGKGFRPALTRPNPPAHAPIIPRFRPRRTVQSVP